jgi:hypothetical protein
LIVTDSRPKSAATHSAAQARSPAFIDARQRLQGHRLDRLVGERAAEVMPSPPIARDAARIDPPKSKAKI